MGEQSSERMIADLGVDLSGLTAVGPVPTDGGEADSSPSDERYRALAAAYVEALTQLSDLQLDYSRLLNAATRVQQRAIQFRQLEHEQVEHERVTLQQVSDAQWRSGVAQAAEARAYAADLEARLDRVNRSMVHRIIHRITGKYA